MITKRDENYWISNDVDSAAYSKIINEGYRMFRENPKSLWDLGTLQEYTKLVIREERKRASKQLVRIIKDWINQNDRNRTTSDPGS